MRIVQIKERSPEPHHNFSKAAFGNDNLVGVNLNRDVLQPGNCRSASVFILGFHAKERQVGSRPALPSQEVGARPLEVEEEAIKSVVVRVSKHHTSAALHRHTHVELLPGLADFVGAAGHLLAEDLVVEVQAATLGGAVGVFPEYLTLAEKLAWKGKKSSRRQNKSHSHS